MKKKFKYRLGTVSQALNWKSPEGKVLSYEPYIREMRVWANLFEEVDVFAPLAKTEILVTVSEYGAENFSFDFVSYEDGIGIKNALKRLWQLPRVLLKLFLFVWRHEVLLIRSPSHFGLFAHVMVFILRKKTITKYAGFFGAYENERMPSLLERNFIRHILSPPHYVLVYGKHHADHLISFIPAAISLDEIAELRKLKDHIKSGNGTKFYSLGKLMPVKNFDLAINAFGLLTQEYPQLEWEYHLIGDGNERENLYQLTKDLKIEDRVFFEGKLSYQAAMEKLTHADFVIMPGTKEGWPKVVIEAWAAGAVPIVVDAGLSAEIINDGVNGFLFEATPEAMKNKLLQVFASPATSENIREHSLEFSKAMAIENFTECAKAVCINRLKLYAEL